jgi:hypothetical protein
MKSIKPSFFFPSFSIFIFFRLNAANFDHEQDYSYTVDNQELYNKLSVWTVFSSTHTTVDINKQALIYGKV